MGRNRESLGHGETHVTVQTSPSSFSFSEYTVLKQKPSEQKTLELTDEGTGSQLKES